LHFLSLNLGSSLVFIEKRGLAVVAVTARPLFSMKTKELPKLRDKKCKAVLSTKETANTS